MAIVPLRRPAKAPTELSDEALARACAGGDPHATAVLFDRMHRPVARYIARLVGSGPDVDDLIQTTFLEVARGAAVYDATRGNVTTWLFAVATNVVRHYRRSHARRNRLRVALSRAPKAPGPDGEHAAHVRSELDRAEAALRQLSDDFREAFVLCELEGLSARRAAEIVGASEAAVWKRVSKARKAIRAAVKGSEP